MISIKVIDVNFFVFLLFWVLFCWGWGGGCLGFVLGVGVGEGFVLGGGGGENVVWGLFWGVGVVLSLLWGGGSWGRGYRE